MMITKYVLMLAKQGGEGGKPVLIYRDEQIVINFIDNFKNLKKNKKTFDKLESNYHKYCSQHKCNIQIPNASDYQKKIANLYVTLKEVPHIEEILMEKIKELKIKLINVSEEIAEAKKKIEEHKELVKSQYISALTAEQKEIFFYDFSDFNEYGYYYYEEVSEVEDDD